MAVGTAVRHDLNKLEAQVDRTDDVESKGSPDIAPDQRKRYLEEHLDLGGAVQGCRLVKILRDRRHTGHIHNHVITDGLPYQRKDDGIQYDLLISHPLVCQRVQPDGS